MGHRDSPKEWRGASEICGTERGVAPAAEKRELEVENFFQQQSAQAKEQQQIPARTSAAVRTALFALRVYKSYFSMLMAGSCRFEPTCSRFAYEAIERFGVRRGCWLAVKRLLRCQPLSGKFGYDPVPETWEDMHSTEFVAVASQEQRQSCPPEVRS